MGWIKSDVTDVPYAINIYIRNNNQTPHHFVCIQEIEFVLPQALAAVYVLLPQVMGTLVVICIVVPYMESLGEGGGSGA